jgi:hypothetical protein
MEYETPTIADAVIDRPAPVDLITGSAAKVALRHSLRALLL